MFSKLSKRVALVDSLLCIGLDPVGCSVEKAESDCVDIIENTKEFAAAFKPNVAFFEALGVEGMKTLQSILSTIPSDIPIILDNKRGDISETARAYATASYDVLHADAVTVNAYMGWDSVQPFVSNNDKKGISHGAFILCKTSNASSHDFQELPLMSGELLFERIASQTVRWANEHVCDLGLVCGATDTESLRKVRGLASEMWILCPGVGAQGGQLQEACSAGLRDDGSGLLIHVSRLVSLSSNRRDTARALRNDINRCRQTFLSCKSLPRCNIPLATTTTTMIGEEEKQEFVAYVVRKRALQFGCFALKSGRVSPYFFNAGELCSDGEGLMTMAKALAKTIHASNISFDVLFGPAYKGIPLAACVAVSYLEMFGENKGFCYNRKEAKDHGEGGVLVGASVIQQRVFVVDDVITAGTAVREAMVALTKEGATIAGVAVCLDRQERMSEGERKEGGVSVIQQLEKENNVRVVSIIQLKDLALFAANHNNNNNNVANEIREYQLKYGV